MGIPLNSGNKIPKVTQIFNVEIQTYGEKTFL